MNKISFRDLIDLEPKPTKIKYNVFFFNYDGNAYLEIEDGGSFIENFLTIHEMKEANIEIIEEDKIINTIQDFQSLLLRNQTTLEKAISVLKDLQKTLIDKVNKLKGGIKE